MSDHTSTDHTSDDDILRRLRAADPVDPATLPSADTPAATDLIDQILSTQPASSAGPSGFGAAPVTALPEPGSVRRSSRISGVISSGRGALVAVAAAVLVLVGAVTVLAPDNTPAALAEVHTAAAATADAGTGRVVTTFSLSFDDAEQSEQTTGRLEAVYDGDDLGLSLELDDVPAGFEADADDFLPALADIRLVDGVAYLQQDDQWFAVDTGGLLGDLVVDYVDPRSVLDTVQTLTETSEVGPVDVDGVATTHYRSLVDIGEETLAQSGWLAFEGMDVEVDGEVTVDLYIDEDGTLRRFDLSGDLRPTDPTEDGSATFEVGTIFSDIGADLTVEAPEDAELIDPLAGAFGDEDDE